MKKNRLMRPSAALFPLAFFAAGILTGQKTASTLLILYFILQILSLCAVDCFRNAAAREPGPRKVDRRFWSSIPMLIFAPVALGIIITLTEGKISRGDLPLILIPWLIIIEQLFEERLYTLNRPFDGNVLALVANGLLFTGLMLDGSNGLSGSFELFWTLTAAGAGTLIAILTSLAIAPAKGFSLVPRNLGFAPKAMVQALLFPAAYFGLTRLIPWDFDRHACGFFAAFALWRISRTVCRRSADESRPLNLLLIAACAVITGAAGFIPALTDPAICCLAALICALIVYLRPSVRNIAGTLLLAAAFACIYLKIQYAAYIAIACGLIAVIVNLKNAFLKKV